MVLIPFDIHHLIAHHGYRAVFTIVMLESAGVPLPGETALILAAGYAGATGRLDIGLVLVCAASAAIVGDNLGYWIGRRFGLQALLRWGKYVQLTPVRLTLGQYLFARHGGKIIFFGRFVAFLRVFAALLAGVNNYPWRAFLFFNALGGVIWAVGMGLAAFWFGDAVHNVAGPLGMVALGVALVGILAGVIFIRRQERIMERRLETIARSEMEPLA